MTIVLARIEKRNLFFSNVLPPKKSSVDAKPTLQPKQKEGMQLAALTDLAGPFSFASPDHSGFAIFIISTVLIFCKGNATKKEKLEKTRLNWDFFVCFF